MYVRLVLKINKTSFLLVIFVYEFNIITHSLQFYADEEEEDNSRA